ncbi:DUF7620 family protein [Streptomyces chumphonensis]|uniref:DUF7620 family protein n=1 Tax=Streptomyces chumphonensis TaxID=1214925 RepID=UPI003D7645B3
MWRIRRRRREQRAGQRAADAALTRAHLARAAAESCRPEVTHLAARLRQLRHQNHFAESIRAAMEGGR